MAKGHVMVWCRQWSEHTRLPDFYNSFRPNSCDYIVPTTPHHRPFYCTPNDIASEFQLLFLCSTHELQRKNRRSVTTMAKAMQLRSHEYIFCAHLRVSYSFLTKLTKVGLVGAPFAHSSKVKRKKADGMHTYKCRRVAFTWNFGSAILYRLHSGYTLFYI